MFYRQATCQDVLISLGMFSESFFCLFEPSMKENEGQYWFNPSLSEGDEEKMFKI